MKSITFKGYANVDDDEVDMVKNAIVEALFDLPYLIDIEFKEPEEL